MKSFGCSKPDAGTYPVRDWANHGDEKDFVFGNYEKSDCPMDAWEARLNRQKSMQFVTSMSQFEGFVWAVFKPKKVAKGRPFPSIWHPLKSPGTVKWIEGWSGTIIFGSEVKISVETSKLHNKCRGERFIEQPEIVDTPLKIDMETINFRFHVKLWRCIHKVRSMSIAVLKRNTLVKRLRALTTLTFVEFLWNSKVKTKKKQKRTT